MNSVRLTGLEEVEVSEEERLHTNLNKATLELEAFYKSTPQGNSVNRTCDKLDAISRGLRVRFRDDLDPFRWRNP